MDINQLNCFITASHTLNFSEAARRNYVSQSTVSRYIGDLEKEFGVRLFSRSHRDVVITDEGKALLPYAIEIVETLKKAKDVVKQMRDGGQGKVTLGCDVTSLSFPTKCIAAFAEKYPGITVDVRRLDEADRSLAITSGEYDFCFMPRDMVPENSSIASIITHNETLSVAAAKGSRFEGRDGVKLSELADGNVLVFSESAAPIVYMEIMDLFRTFHITPKIKSTYDDPVSVCVSASSGLGAAVIPSSIASCISNKYVDVFPIDDADTSIAYVMAWSKSISNPAAKLFMDTVKKYAEGDDDAYGL